MAHYNQKKKNINTLIVSALKSQQVQLELEDSINIIYGVLDTIFKMVDTEEVPVTKTIPCLAILSKKRESDIANIVKKTHNFMRKTKNYLKNPETTLRNYIQISQMNGKKKGLLGMWVFSAKSRYLSIYFRKLFQF